MTSQTIDVKQALRTSSFLQALSPGDLDKLADIAQLHTVPAGTVIYQEGQLCDDVHVVSSGLIGLDMCMPRQGCTRILTVGPGELLGWSALLAEGRMSVRATATSDSTLIGLPARQLRQLCDDDHDIGYAVMQQISQALSRRLLSTRLQMLDMFRETQPVANPPHRTAFTGASHS